jgi:hypothetical protein
VQERPTHAAINKKADNLDCNSLLSPIIHGGNEGICIPELLQGTEDRGVGRRGKQHYTLLVLLPKRVYKHDNELGLKIPQARDEWCIILAPVLEFAGAFLVGAAASRYPFQIAKFWKRRLFASYQHSFLTLN